MPKIIWLFWIRMIYYNLLKNWDFWFDALGPLSKLAQDLAREQENGV